MTLWSPQGRREAGGELPQVLGGGGLEIFCWAPVIFLGEIIQRKGQDIWVFFGKVPKFDMKN
jgi:hypothetical protein